MSEIFDYVNHTEGCFFFENIPFAVPSRKRKLNRKFYAISRSNRSESAVVHFYNTQTVQRFQKIDGTPRVTKLNRIFGIILLLLKKKKTRERERDLLKNRILTHTRTHKHRYVVYLIRDAWQAAAVAGVR